MGNRCARNRKRSKRRAIYCPTHGCYIDSVSQKYRLYADCASHLQSRGVGRRQSLLLTANQTAVPLDGEWLEAFWCPMCEGKTWYHVTKEGDRTYSIQPAPRSLWQQVTGVIQVNGNPSVSEFTFRNAHNRLGYRLKDFRSAM
ncbi:MAG: hypothetical protein VKL39_11120 [Leptolyngbyaceae bacterium]|nr:hypothetical protein [Leptolyngbyaceae bacterium]